MNALALALALFAASPDGPGSSHFLPEVEATSRLEISVGCGIDLFPRSPLVLRPVAQAPVSLQWARGPHVGVQGIASWAVAGIGMLLPAPDTAGAGVFSPTGAKVAAVGFALSAFDAGWRSGGLEIVATHRFRWLDFVHPVERTGLQAGWALGARDHLLVGGDWAFSTSDRFSGPAIVAAYAHALRL